VLRILRFIIFGIWDYHKHEWIDDDNHKANYFCGNDHNNNELPNYSIQYFYYKCKTCGLRKIQKFKES
jgi:hypothetical protein